MSQIFDDGIVRFQLPWDWQFVSNETHDDITYLGFKHKHESMNLKLDVHRGCIVAQEGEIPSSHPGVLMERRELEQGETRKKPVQLRTSFWIATSFWESHGMCCWELRIKLNEQTVHVIRFFLHAIEFPEEKMPDFLRALQLLKRHIRKTECSLGQPRMNTSQGFLEVPPLGVSFPETLGGLGFDFAQDYESSIPGEGLGLRYSDAGYIRADLYVYTAGLEYLEGGIDSGEIRARFTQTEAEIHRAPCYSEVEKIRDVNLLIANRVDEMQFLHGTYRLRTLEDGRIWISETALTAFKGQFIKVRFTFPEDQAAGGGAAFQRFMEDVVAVIAV